MSEGLLGGTSRDSAGETLSEVPLVLAFVAYSGVAAALYVETGNSHVGMSWPVTVGIVTLLIGVGLERRGR